LQHVDEEDLNKRNASILNKFILNISRDPTKFLISCAGGIYILVVKRVGDSNIGLNIGDLEGTGRIKKKTKDRKKTRKEIKK